MCFCLFFCGADIAAVDIVVAARKDNLVAQGALFTVECNRGRDAEHFCYVSVREAFFSSLQNENALAQAFDNTIGVLVEGASGKLFAQLS